MWIIIFLLGLIIGSFLNSCIYRIPQGFSLISPSSFCPLCKTKIKWFDNIPIISFILLKGKCRNCQKNISIIYPIVEFLNGVFYIFLFNKFSLSYHFFVYSFFVSSLIVIAFIDFKHQIIPNVITLPFIFLGIIIIFLLKVISFKDSLLAGLIGGSFFYLLSFYKQGIGGGDIKLIIMQGIFLGFKKMIITIIIAFCSASLIALFLILIKKKTFKDRIPFGPFLAMSAIYALFFGEKTILWYF